MFDLLVVLVLFPIMYVSLFTNILITESPTVLERAEDSVFHLSHLCTDVTSCSDFFPLVYLGLSLGSDCINF